MTQQKLNQCMLLHVHHQKTDNLILTDIAKEFVNRSERRQNFFWTVLASDIHYKI